jgi:hypothetical protein
VASSHISSDDHDGLRTTNIDSWLDDLPLEDLFELFISVCMVAEKLGFRYTRVDILCVVQDP